MATTEQPTNQPTNKVSAAGIGGVVATLVVFLAGQFDIDVTPEAAAALATLIAFVAGYFRRERIESTPRPAGNLGLTLLETLVVLLIAALLVLAVLTLT